MCILKIQIKQFKKIIQKINLFIFFGILFGAKDEIINDVFFW